MSPDWEYELADEAYLVVRKSAAAVDAYERRLSDDQRRLYRGLREATSFIDPRAYRGIGAWGAVDNDLSSGHAWKLAWEAPTKAELTESLRMLRDPEKWDIVHVSLANLRATEATLGFDVGWWANPYSIIWDSVVCPVWHPPDPRDFAAVGQRLRGLNGNVLFESPQDAEEFRAWYETRDWAERDDFVVVRVNTI